MDATITFRTTGDQREHLKAEAKAHDVTVSQILRDVLARGLEAVSSKNPFAGMNASLVPLIQQFAPVIQHLAKTIPFTQPARTVARAAPTGPGQPLYAARQTFSPPSGALPLSAPPGGGYVSSPSTPGGVAYISTNSAGQRIATNSAGATIRLS